MSYAPPSNGTHSPYQLTHSDPVIFATVGPEAAATVMHALLHGGSVDGNSYPGSRDRFAPRYIKDFIPYSVEYRRLHDSPTVAILKRDRSETANADRLGLTTWMLERQQLADVLSQLYGDGKRADFQRMMHAIESAGRSGQAQFRDGALLDSLMRIEPRNSIPMYAVTASPLALKRSVIAAPDTVALKRLIEARTWPGKPNSPGTRASLEPLYQDLIQTPGGDEVTRDDWHQAVTAFGNETHVLPKELQLITLGQLRGMSTIPKSHRKYVKYTVAGIAADYWRVDKKREESAYDTQGQPPISFHAENSDGTTDLVVAPMREDVDGAFVNRFPGYATLHPELVRTMEDGANRSVAFYPRESSDAWDSHQRPALWLRDDCAVPMEQLEIDADESDPSQSEQTPTYYSRWVYERDDQAALISSLKLVSPVGYSHFEQLKADLAAIGRPLRCVRLPTGLEGTPSDYQTDQDNWIPQLTEAEALRPWNYTIVTIGRAWDQDGAALFRFAEESPLPMIYKDVKTTLAAEGWATLACDAELALETIRDEILPKLREQGRKPVVTIKAARGARSEAVWHVTDASTKDHGITNINSLLRQLHAGGNPFDFNLHDPVLIQPYVPAMTLDQLGVEFPDQEFAIQLGTPTEDYDPWVRRNGEVVRMSTLTTVDDVEEVTKDPITGKPSRKKVERERPMTPLERAKVVWENVAPVNGKERKQHAYLRAYYLPDANGRYRLVAGFLNFAPSARGHGKNGSGVIEVRIPGVEMAKQPPMTKDEKAWAIVARNGATTGLVKLPEKVWNELEADGRFAWPKQLDNGLAPSPRIHPDDLPREFLDQIQPTAAGTMPLEPYPELTSAFRGAHIEVPANRREAADYIGLAG